MSYDCFRVLGLERCHRSLQYPEMLGPCHVPSPLDTLAFPANKARSSLTETTITARHPITGASLGPTLTHRLPRPAKGLERPGTRHRDARHLGVVVGLHASRSRVAWRAFVSLQLQRCCGARRPPTPHAPPQAASYAQWPGAVHLETEIRCVFCGSKPNVMPPWSRKGR